MKDTHIVPRALVCPQNVIICIPLAGPVQFSCYKLHRVLLQLLHVKLLNSILLYSHSRHTVLHNGALLHSSLPVQNINRAYTQCVISYDRIRMFVYLIHIDGLHRNNIDMIIRPNKKKWIRRLC